MKHPIVVPQLGLMDSFVLVEWLHPTGSSVERGEPLASIETDKVQVEVESPADGVLHIAVDAGPDQVAVETVLGTVDGGEGT